MYSYEILLKNALKLRSIERAQLAEGLLRSLESPNDEIDKVWEEEALKRYEAYKQEKIKAKDLDEVMKRYS